MSRMIETKTPIISGKPRSKQTDRISETRYSQLLFVVGLKSFRSAQAIAGLSDMVEGDDSGPGKMDVGRSSHPDFKG